MDTKVKTELTEAVVAKGICGAGERRVREADRDELVAYYLQNPDWAMERGIPTLETLREQFGDLGERGIFVDREFHGETLNERQVYVFHNCRGTIRTGLNVEKGLAPMLYIANGCRLRIAGIGEKVQKGRMEIPVCIIGKNDISAKSNKYVEFVKYKRELK